MKKKQEEIYMDGKPWYGLPMHFKTKRGACIDWIKWIWFYHIYIPLKKIFHLNFYEKDRDKMIELARKIGKAKFYPNEDGTLWKVII